MRTYSFFFVFLGWYSLANAQTDTSKRSQDLTFTGTRLNPYTVDSDSSGKVVFSAYIDTYYASYSDTAGAGSFQKFPTCAPKSDAVGLNILQFSARYASKRFRSTATLFFGDSPKSCWSDEYNYIQEANLGFHIGKNLWLDAGFFRTHFGLESIQPRENITMSFATTTYFEPYFLSGAKLTWAPNTTFAFQLNAFNSFNQFGETNKNKAVGASFAFTPTNLLSVSLSTIACDESPAGSTVNKMRIYTDLYVIYKHHRLTAGCEFNFGSQQHSDLQDSTKTAYMFSSLVALKYRITEKFGVYVRGEFFSDKNEILTGPVQNAYHQLIGLEILGVTTGIEFKPIPNSYLRFEGRQLTTTESDEKIFYYNNQSSNIRYEMIIGLGVWF